ncbi:hypothetical protein MBLNU459_g2407t1 [Dothideomycetes sp. NU459]
MAVLLTGGTGKTSVRIAQLLQAANVPFLLASRNPTGTQATRFDWLDESTFKNPFAHKFPTGERIRAVYLIAPQVQDPVEPMNAFINLAVREHGVRRFVLLTGSSVEKGGYYTGKVWSHLEEIGVEHCVLRATWFMENFSESWHRATIKDESRIYTACGDGKIPFVSAADIAAVAYHALTDKEAPSNDYRVLGPELLTHDQIAVIFSKTSGRQVEHIRLSEEQKVQRQQDAGVPAHIAKLMAGLESMSARGDEDRMNLAVEEVTGKPPQSFASWVQQNKTVWL